MKLSAMSTDHEIDVLTVAAVELEPMLADEKVISMTVSVKPNAGESRLELGLRMAKTILEAVLLFSQTYRQNVYRILAAFFKCSPEDIGRKTLAENWTQIRECFNDEVFLSFFPSLGRLAPKTSSDTLPDQDP
jgi:hypothetical protein